MKFTLDRKTFRYYGSGLPTICDIPFANQIDLESSIRHMRYVLLLLYVPKERWFWRVETENEISFVRVTFTMYSTDRARYS